MLDKRRKEKYKSQEVGESQSPLDLEEILDFDFYLDDISSLNDETIDDDLIYNEEEDEAPLTDVISYRDVLPDSEFADEDEEVQYRDLRDAEIVEKKSLPKRTNQNIPEIIEPEIDKIESETNDYDELDEENLEETQHVARSEEDLKVNSNIEEEDNIEVESEFINRQKEKSQPRNNKVEEVTNDNEEDVALNADEIANILESEPESDFFIESDEEESDDDGNDFGGSFFDEDIELGDGLEDIEEEDSITLSPDELGNITGEDEEEDSITLSPDELGNITGEDEEEDSITLSPMNLVT